MASKGYKERKKVSYMYRLYSAMKFLVFLWVLLPLAASYRAPCDPLVPEYCALPFPNSYYTAPDPSTVTGLRVNFSTLTFPVDIVGRLVDPTEWNTLGKWRKSLRSRFGKAGSCAWALRASCESVQMAQSHTKASVWTPQKRRIHSECSIVRHYFIGSIICTSSDCTHFLWMV